MGCLSLSHYESLESPLKLVRYTQEKCSESCVNPYRYGFNGMEKDDEVNGQSGGNVNFTFRLYNSRIGKFFSKDPLSYSYPYHDLEPCW